MSKEATSEAVAQWMLAQVESDGDLYQDDAASRIEEEFGQEFIYENENGNPAISKLVLQVFQKISEETVVWERGERMWRKRESYDDPGRQQH